MISLSPFLRHVAVGVLWSAASAGWAQEVCLPAPRLLTVFPMGGQVGTTFDVSITGENIEDAGALLFSAPQITAQPKRSAEGKIDPHKFVVTIAPDAPVGVQEARMMTRLGISASRAFSVSPLLEVTRTGTNTTVGTALALPGNTICNATTTRRAIDCYSFAGVAGKRVIVDCAAPGIDSKLNPVIIVADEQGRDLAANRTGGVIDFIPPVNGRYFVKVHSLTFQGGPEYFYRLALLDAPPTGPIVRQAATQTVSAMSWSSETAAPLPQIAEVEPNDRPNEAQKITLPCEIAGQFYPAADVDTFEFSAKKGEIWWVEVVSERLGLATDPFVVVQQVTEEAGREKLTDVAEINDIPSPMKLSSNGYSYDGPPFDAGSADPLGKVEIKEDGIYRLQVRDLFGGTRTDPSHVYRLIVRRPAPDFALAAWALHMTLRNGDRNALSKPVALRGGATMALEVVVVRKDGFDGEIALTMSGLPEGVQACGLKIPAGKSKGVMLITAAEGASAGFAMAQLQGSAQIDGRTVTRPGRLASMVWPVKDATQEIPKPRLLADFPVSTSGAELAPVTIAAGEDKTWEGKAGEKITVPLKFTWRAEFAGTSIKLKALGDGFEALKEFDVPMNAVTSEAVLDLAALKTPPGEYTLAFYGPAVTKYRSHPEAVKVAEREQQVAEKEALTVAEAAKRLADEAKAAPEEKRGEAEDAARVAADKLKTADAARTEAARRMKAATETAAPKDTVDIVISEPIRISVKPAEAK